MGDEIIKVLNELCNKFGIAIDWTSANVLPYLGELCGKFIKWEISTSIAWIVMAVIVVIIGLIFVKVTDKDEIVCFITFFAILGAIMLIGFQTFDIIECCTFPEKAIYDYINSHTDIFK